ncbi:uncharacterized protein LOC116343905 [Contarinia nasturtii]|uniref:uncharacterized protein LOC116343905 n=1 Tax=Contarinia nasturtii TaxID=265458 RepID=UPI0012D410E7|nr:uncharacterized protein LOC116343905 [Contarinia nasturtii]
MGNAPSKKGSVVEKTPEKSVAAINDEHSPIVDDIIKANKMLEPKTPAIPQTPLTQTIAHHLNRISNDGGNQNQAIKTPSYLLRKKILYDLGYNYSIKEDPRSPSIAIPRTPINLTETPQGAVNESDSSSFQYNTTLDDSCRDFNAKLDDITMEEAVMVEGVQKVECDENKKQDLCDRKTPNGEMDILPDFGNRPNANKKEYLASDACETDSKQAKSSEENIDPDEMMCSTPFMNKNNRTGRIPLSVINRRGASAEQALKTPLHSKINNEYKSDLSFSKLDDSRGSARKSKIPVFKK